MKKFLLVLFVVSSSILSAQQDAQYTQYMYNTVSVNPAYTGSRGVLSVAGLYRAQWIGLEGAPTTQTINIHSPVSERVGLGLSIVNDEIGNGTNQETYFDALFSYTIPLENTAKLSFGLKAGGHLLNIDFNKLERFNPSSSVPQESNIDNRFSPNFGAGIYYHSDAFYVGLSVPNFLETEHFDNAGGNTFLAQERMNWYAIAGTVTELSYNWKFKPTVLFKAVNGAPLQVDLSANFLYNDKFTFGGAYRWSAAWSALFGFQLSDQLMLGLAYDKETTALGSQSFNNGSFEVLLRYEFLTKYKKVVTPRFF